MKKTAILALLLLMSCASNDGFETGELRQCNVGDPLEINAGFVEQDTIPGGRINLTVEVQNNSDSDVTVKSVRVDPQVRPEEPLDVQGGARDFGREIAEGESATFEVPMSVSLRGGMMNAPGQRGVSYRVDAAVTVRLETGESYRCRFRLPVPF